MPTSTRRSIQVYLDGRQEKALRRLAVEQDTSISDLIRRGVDLLLQEDPKGLGDP